MFYFSLLITAADINHSWKTILQCGEAAYSIEFCANLGH